LTARAVVMIAYLKDNWRDLLAAVALLILFALGADMAAQLAARTGIDLLHFVNALGGLSKLVMTVASVWFTIAVSLPSLHRFIAGRDWDATWNNRLSEVAKFYVCCGFAGVLLIVAAICFR